MLRQRTQLGNGGNCRQCLQFVRPRQVKSPHLEQVTPTEAATKTGAEVLGKALDQYLIVFCLRWDAFHEGLDWVAQVEAYLARYGHYPERV